MISFDVNNGGRLCLEQAAHDGYIRVTSRDAGGAVIRADAIEPGDAVMLVNLYRYVKDNDIKTDFINPHGANDWRQF